MDTLSIFLETTVGIPRYTPQYLVEYSCIVTPEQSWCVSRGSCMKNAENTLVLSKLIHCSIIKCVRRVNSCIANVVSAFLKKHCLQLEQQFTGQYNSSF